MSILKSAAPWPAVSFDRIDLEKAVDLDLQCCRRYRIPGPLRLAHRYCKF